MAKRRARKKSRPVARKSAGKKTPSARRRRNPPAGELMSRGVVELAYRHVKSKQRKPFEHEFADDVKMYAMPDGSISLRASQPLHDLFIVSDDT